MFDSSIDSVLISSRERGKTIIQKKKVMRHNLGSFSELRVHVLGNEKGFSYYCKCF